MSYVKPSLAMWLRYSVFLPRVAGVGSYLATLRCIKTTEQSGGTQHLHSTMGDAQTRPPDHTQSASIEDTPGKITLGDFAVDEYAPIKVVVIGAGFGGILAGIRYYCPHHSSVSQFLSPHPRLPQKIAKIELNIYEKSAAVGGTWYNNRYP